MKHLKRYNEDLQPHQVDELKEFCENCLAYLLDEGFSLSYENIYGGIGTALRISLYIPTPGSKQTLFKWDDVKEYYIPFLQLLSRRYELSNNRFHGLVGFQSTKDEYVSLDRCVRDKLPSNIGAFWCIKIHVDDKKRSV